MKRSKLIYAVAIVMVVMVCAVCFTACDTQETFGVLVTNELDKLPDGSGVKSIKWSANDPYTLEVDNNGKVVAKDTDYIVCLEKDPNKDFVILNLADVQLGEVEIEWEASFVEVAIKTIAKLVEDVKPDLITLTGDQGYGEKLAFKTVYDYIDSFGIPWAPVFGNHDNDARVMSVAAQSEGLEQYANCLFKTGPDNLGVIENGDPAYGNYIINIVEKSENDFKVVKSILMVNSSNNVQMGTGAEDGELPVNAGSYAFLSETQIAWYKWAVQGVQKYGDGSVVSSMMVLHIPIYAFNEAFCEASNADLTATDYENVIEYGKSISVEQGMNDDSIWAEGYKDSFGVRHENCASPAYDDHVFEAILDFDDNPETEEISTDLVLAGHDHINCTVNKYKGVYLAYALKTGSGCYWESDMSGGSVITFGSDGATNIRHEFYTPSEVPDLPRWVIWAIGIGSAIIVAVIVAVPTAFAVKKKKSGK